MPRWRRQYAVGCPVTKAEHDQVMELAARRRLFVADIVRAGLRAQLQKMLQEEATATPPQQHQENES